MLTNELIPAIIQDFQSGRVLMLGYMNEEALQLTRDTQRVTFFSRSKNRLWVKGESSGNFLLVKNIALDCDQDALLIQAEPCGPTCHTGSISCFGLSDSSDAEFIEKLSGVIRSRFQSIETSSYVSQLYQSGIKRIAQKIGEEGVEVALAAQEESTEELRNEMADLFFHLLILLEAKNLKWTDIISILKARQK